LVCRRIV